MAAAVDEAYANGALGANAFGSGKRIDMVLHRGAGAYICGEETAMMNSHRGQARQSRGSSRRSRPRPALFGMPTTINNVETLAAVAAHPHRGAPSGTRGSAWAIPRAPAPS